MAALIDDLRALLGPRGVLEGADVAAYVTDWRGIFHGAAACVLRPANVAELSGAMRLCAAAGVAVVPQGGNTSLVGGATPGPDGAAVVVNLARLNRVRGIDPVDFTMVVEAGVTLKAAQAAAAAAGCLLPLSIGSEGSAQIGGVLATNAGGNNTLRYGNARDLVLGLEVVLADGQVWEGLRRLRKDNTGYCLRQLFVGSEGTLGIISAAVLKLAPLPTARLAALCAVDGAASALALLGRFQRHDAAALQAFEFMSAGSMGLVLEWIEGAVLPLSAPAPAYVLVELAGTGLEAGLRAGLEEVLGAALEDGLVGDAVVAESEAQRRALWRLREEHSEAEKRAGASVKNDVSVPASRVPALIERAGAACEALIPGIRVVPFGHLGDGNIHFNVSQPEGMEAAAFMARAGEIMACVNEVVWSLGGSFSAEHGVGQLKPGMMEEWRGGVEIGLMRSIKAALDPGGIMNPGKIFEVDIY